MCTLTSYITKLKMIFLPLFEIILSESEVNEKKCVKTARIISGKGQQKRKNFNQSYFFTRLEISVSIDGQKGIGINLANSDMTWLMNCIKTKVRYSSIDLGKKLYVFNAIDETKFSLNTIESERIFGIILTENDMKVLIDNEKILQFLLKHTNAKDEVLKDLTIETFVAVVGNNVRLILKEMCDGCNGKSNSHNYCNKYIKDIGRHLEILSEILENVNFDAAFYEKFNKLMTILNISSADRIAMTQMVIPELRADNKLILSKLCAMLDLKQGMAFDLDNIFQKMKY